MTDDHGVQVNGTPLGRKRASPFSITHAANVRYSTVAPVVSILFHDGYYFAVLLYERRYHHVVVMYVSEPRVSISSTNLRPSTTVSMVP